MNAPTSRNAFTLIELLIVVAIIAILAAIAVPNFLEAQVRAKVSRVQADLRTLATGLQAYRVDHNEFPEGTDDTTKMPPEVIASLGTLAPGYYTFSVRNSAGAIAGRDFATMTTPVAYLTSILYDPFAPRNDVPLIYCYRNAKDRKNGFVVTSAGPDADLLSADGGGPGKGTTNPNRLSTFTDTKNPSRLGDINERDVIHYIEDTSAGVILGVNTQFGSLRAALGDLTYDPTNGTVSDGDLWRLAD